MQSARQVWMRCGHRTRALNNPCPTRLYIYPHTIYRTDFPYHSIAKQFCDFPDTTDWKLETTHSCGGKAGEWHRLRVWAKQTVNIWCMLTPRSRITSGGIRGAQAMCQHGWIDGWMDGWMDGWLDGWMVGWVLAYFCMCTIWQLNAKMPATNMRASGAAKLNWEGGSNKDSSRCRSILDPESRILNPARRLSCCLAAAGGHISLLFNMSKSCR